MFIDLGKVVLRSGKEAEAAVISGPDNEWRERIGGFLNHKGGIWNWQVGEQLAQSLGVESQFYVLHHHGIPFSHIMTTTLYGVGLLGHVYTVPERRGEGAASLLMGKQIEHFRETGGRALYLSTGYDTSPYHIYRKHGFEGIGGGSGCMTFTPRSLQQFEDNYFAAGQAALKPLNWEHWPASAALFISAQPGIIRNLAARLLGRSFVEGRLLPFVQQERENARTGIPPTAYVAQKIVGGGVVGLASTRPDPLWPETSILDIYCHSEHWYLAQDLMKPLVSESNQRLVAYVENGFAQKESALLAAGFQKTGQLAKQLSRPEEAGVRDDVGVYELLD